MRRTVLIPLFAGLALACPVGLFSSTGARADDAPIASGEQASGKIHVDVLSLKLIDLVNRRSYGPGVTSAGCHAEPGARSTCWAVFAAPPAGTKSMNLQFYEDFDLIAAPVAN